MPDVRRLETRNASLTYTLSGDAGSSAVPVVLIHGWGCQRGDWTAVASELSVRRRVVALDLPSFGESCARRTRYTVRAFAEDVSAVIDAEGLGGAAVAGHSMGGAVALETALLRPDVSSVIGVDSFHYLQVYPAQDERAVRDFMSVFRTDPDNSIAALVSASSVPGTDPALIAEMTLGQITAARSPDSLNALEETLRWDMDAALAATRVRVVALVSGALLAAEATARYGDRIEIRPISQGSHYFLREEPQVTAAAIEEVIARQE
ncbi:MAG TPA: alpha/beta hydrolase [Trebonia sp.]|jgi:pimeloyl-ACP methyl ester carboxylesterase|nr:alpha/beta hydrolase [Trebonia sp.]